MTDKSADRTVGGILHSLMKSPRFAQDRARGRVPGKSELTSLGVLLIRQDDGHCFINMSEVRVFTGLAEFIQMLAGELLRQSCAASGDIMTQQVIDAQLTPELAQLGIAHVSVYIRSRIASHLSCVGESFRRQLRLAFDAIQSARWGGLLFAGFFSAAARPDSAKHQDPEPPALLFPFHVDPQTEKEGYFLLLEHDAHGKFLRITVERAEDSRLYLKRIPHRVVTDMGDRHTLQNIGKIAEQIYQGIHRECQNQQDEYAEIPGRQPALFERLISAGMKDLATIKFRWPLEDSASLLFDRDRSTIRLLGKVLLLFEDQGIVDVLAAGNLLEMFSDSRRVFLDLSRAGACLNISLYEQREAVTMDEHLHNLPTLSRLVKGTAASLQGVRVLLIHHVTSQILGLIKAFDHLQCAFARILFVKYKGVVPDGYLEALFTLPEDRFRYYALQRVEARDTVEGFYFLSRQYSPVDDLEAVQLAILKDRLDYFQAMRIVAGHLFFREACAAKRLGQWLLLVEDGGYLAPLINRFCLEGRTLGEALRHFEIDPADPVSPVPPQDLDIPLQHWLKDIFPGSVEHTRNGYDQVLRVQTEFGGLAFPACSIAISDLKNIEEARECAAALLHAVESIFHGMGRLISRRHALVLGCRGNIGRNLVQELGRRIVHGGVCGVDIVVDGGGEGCSSGCAASTYIERRTAGELPEERLLDLDLIVGTVGLSVLKEDMIEKLVLRGRKEKIFFASGSTKTVEFADLSQWLQKLLDAPQPTIGGIPVSVGISPIKDPQTGLVQGNRARIHFRHPLDLPGRPRPVAHKDLYLLGDLMPINFLYYGVPAEIIDEVLCQLLQVCLGFVRSLRDRSPLPARLLAVDHEIDAEARLCSPA